MATSGRMIAGGATRERRWAAGPAGPAGPAGERLRAPGPVPAGGAWRARRALGAAAAWALSTGLAAGCGAGDAAGPAGVTPGTVLFAGPAAALLPHVEGRVARFRASIESDDGETAAIEWQSESGATDLGGAFPIEQHFADGSTARIGARDTGDTVRVESIAGADGAALAVDPPAVLVRTPAVAGEPIESSFARVLPVAVRTAEGVAHAAVAFVGRTTRTPTGLVDVRADGRLHPGAIRYAIRATASGRLRTPAGDVALALEADGEEHIAPGVGVVLASERIALRAGTASASLRVRSERLGEP